MAPVFSRRALLLRAAESGEHVEIFERRGVALDLRAGGDLLEQAAHDFPGTRLGQRLGEADVVRLGHGTDLPGDVLAKLLAKLGAGLHAGLEGDEGDEGLAFQIIRAADDGSFGDVVVADDGALNFSGSVACVSSC